MDMPDTENIETTQSAQQDQGAEIRPLNLSRRAAAVEAAYILEAVRK
jgi:hypothetical protein